MLTKPCCRALGKLLELGDAIVVTAEETREGGLGVGSDWATLPDAVVPTDLLLVTLEHLLRVQHLKGILQQVDLTLVISGCVGCH